MTPFEVYKSYLSLRNHFTKEKYDYHKFCGKSKCSIKSFYSRRDRFWFEKISRQKTDKEIEEFFVSNFITITDPSNLWIGELIKDGDERYTQWKKRTQSLSYIFKEECERLFSETQIDDVFKSKQGHPIILKKFLSGEVSIETLVLLDKILEFRKKFDINLKDPVWETVSMKIKKYSPFIHSDIFHFRKILKEVILVEK